MVFHIGNKDTGNEMLFSRTDIPEADRSESIFFCHGSRLPVFVNTLTRASAHLSPSMAADMIPPA